MKLQMALILLLAFAAVIVSGQEDNGGSEGDQGSEIKYEDFNTWEEWVAALKASGGQRSAEDPAGDQGSETTPPSGDTQGSDNTPSGNEESPVRYEDYGSWEEWVAALKAQANSGK